MELYDNTKSDLSFLKSTLGTSNFQYQRLVDGVAKEILQCSIDYFNESQEQEKSNDYPEEAMKLAKLAESIAVNDATKNKVKENISTLEGMKDRELRQAIDVLKSIREAYEKACKQIDLEVRKMELTMSYNQSVNYSKVNEMKRNALDWNKVVDLIKNTIQPENVEKIKISNKQSAVKEYQSLVDFILVKLNNYQKNQVKYICYWKSISTTQSNTSSNQKTAGKLEENDGCLFAVGRVVGKYWWMILLIIILISIFSFTSNSDFQKINKTENDIENNENYDSNSHYYQIDEQEYDDEDDQYNDEYMYNSHNNDNLYEDNSDEEEDENITDEYE